MVQGAFSAKARAGSALELDAQWQRLAVPIGVAHDGKRWIGAVEHDLVVFDGEAEVNRFPVMAAGGDRLAALPDGGWVAGARLLGADGGDPVRRPRVGQSLRPLRQRAGDHVQPRRQRGDHRGRGAPRARALNRECGNAGSSRGALARLTFDRKNQDAAPAEREVDRARGASRLRGRGLKRGSPRWRAESCRCGRRRKGAPRTATIDGDALATLAWAGNRHLVGTRTIDGEHTEIVVLDRKRGYAATAKWVVEGMIYALAVRPGGTDIAVGTSWYRAHTTVEVDEKRIELYGLDGTRRARASTSPVSR